MPRWFKITLWRLAVAVLCLGALYTYAIWSIRNVDWGGIQIYKEYSARDAIMLDLSSPDCLTRETVLAQAQARGWGIENAETLGQCQSPDGISNWLRVTTEDGFLLPGNLENVTYFGFDENACSVFLPANAGVGETCPDL